jgi:hypothetical protein
MLDKNAAIGATFLLLLLAIAAHAELTRLPHNLQVNSTNFSDSQNPSTMKKIARWFLGFRFRV